MSHRVTGSGGNTGVEVFNVEGNYVVGAPLLVQTGTDVINSCASDPLLSSPQTLCTANYPSKSVYVIEGNNPPTVTHMVPSDGSGEISFSGGFCLNCGIAMDAIHSKAVIGLSIAGKPGFQFLDLSNGSAPVPETPPIVSRAGQISEDPLIDPINNLLLSPGEGEKCCAPNYEIADIKDTKHPVFYENPIGTQPGFPGLYPDSAAEDCSAGIVLSTIEATTTNISTPYIADLTKACFSPSCGAPAGTWTDAASLFYPLSGSKLRGPPLPSDVDTGPIAIAQGGSHEGVLGQELLPSSPGNTITAFRLNYPFKVSAPFAAWVT